MIHFAVVMGVVPAVQQVRHALADALDATRYFAGDRFEQVGPSGGWVAAGIAAVDPLCEPRVVACGDALAVLDGSASGTGHHREDLAGHLLDSFVQAGPPGVHAALTGTYGFVGISPTLGLRAFGDFSGLQPLFWGHGPGFAVVSNRSTTVRELVGGEGWDLHAMSWLVGYSEHFGERMPAVGSSLLIPGSEAQVAWGDHKVKIVRSDALTWPAPNDEPGPDPTPSEWDEITAAAIDYVRSLHDASTRMIFFLTGGKDSRLALALAKAAGLSDEQLAVRTMGPPDSPEVEVAKAVADAAGFAHKRMGPPVDDEGPSGAIRHPDAAWLDLCHHLYRFDGGITPWDGITDDLSGTVIQVKGFGGELYRRTNVKNIRKRAIMTLDELSAAICASPQPHDPLGLLRPEERARQVELRRAWVQAAVADVRLDLVPERFFIEQHLSQWNGQIDLPKPGRINVNPLIQPALAQKVLEVPLAVRQEERFHFEIMRRAAPELVGIPFLDDTWAAAVRDGSPLPLPAKPFPTAVRTRTGLLGRVWARTRGRGRARRPAAVLRPEPYRYLTLPGMDQLIDRAADETAMGSVCDMARLAELARDPDRIGSAAEVKSFLSCVAMALALLGRDEAVLDRPMELLL